MSGAEKLLDPICDMTVDVADARERGLVHEHAGRTYAFCSPGCKTRFAAEPDRYVAKVDAWLRERGASALAHAHGVTAAPPIDAGVRAWYQACRCCLSDAFPAVVEALDKERDAAKAARSVGGICEDAESTAPST